MTRRILMLLAAASALCAAAEPFFFIQLSDPQFGMYTSNASIAQDQANLAFAIGAANRLHPKFVIVTGDLVNKPADAGQIDALKSELGKIRSDIPLYLVAGNHDVGNEPTPESLAEYRKRIGRDYYTFDQDGMRGIVLNSVLIHSPQKAEAEAAAQLKWLQAELDRARTDGKQIVIFQHHAYFVKSADEPDGYFNIPLARRKQYLDLFRQYGVKTIFAGHLHRNAVASDGGIEMITTGPVGMPLGDARSGFRVVLVGDTVQHRFYDFGALPPKLDIADWKPKQ